MPCPLVLFLQAEAPVVVLIVEVVVVVIEEGGGCGRGGRRKRSSSSSGGSGGGGGGDSSGGGAMIIYTSLLIMLFSLEFPPPFILRWRSLTVAIPSSTHSPSSPPPFPTPRLSNKTAFPTVAPTRPRPLPADSRDSLRLT